MFLCCCAGQEGQEVSAAIDLQDESRASQPASDSKEQVESKVVDSPEPATVSDGAPRTPPYEFRVKVEKAPGHILGVELDLLDGVHGHVACVKPGLVENYNSTAADDDRVKTNDFLMSVNGAAGDVQKLLRMIKSQNSVDMLFRRTTPIIVPLDLEASNNMNRGLKQASSGTTLLISEFHESFNGWNEANPKRAISVNDRVVEVNGVQEPEGMLNLIRDGGKVSLTIVSPLR